MSKIAVKKLTGSDLTFFEWQFRTLNKGNQKSINLNTNIFINKLYPALPDLREENQGRFPVDLTLLGPGKNGPYNLQRKITKTGDSYKNWRLNGEFVHNPDTQPDRFNSLQADDYVVMVFEGRIVPQSLRAYFIASNLEEDAALHRALLELTEGKSMVEASLQELREAIRTATPDDDHPIYELALDEYIEDAVYSGTIGTRRLYERRSGTTMSQAQLQNARNRAEEVGQQGEELVNDFLQLSVESGELARVLWTSETNAVAPFDFEIEEAEGARIVLDAKSTTGGFSRALHVSVSELIEMKEIERRYDIYRIYDLTENGGKLRIAEDMKEFATSILDTFESLPNGVRPDSVSIDPTVLPFGEEQRLAFRETEEENQD